MGGRYLIEVRTGGHLKQRLRDIIYDVADEFGVRGAVDPRPVPHITLFGPYDTNDGPEVKRRLLDTFEDFDAVPYRIDGFGTFPNTKVVYANVIPSPELRTLRRSISRRLRPICEGYPSYDEDWFYEFHITVALRDVGEQFNDVRRYVREGYNPQFDAYATRVSNLDGQSMLWEYDVPRGTVLDPDTATTAEAWQQTEQALDRHRSADDHDDLEPTPNGVGRAFSKWTARLKREW
jgi:2'-5' RNA ligase